MTDTNATVAPKPYRFGIIQAAMLAGEASIAACGLVVLDWGGERSVYKPDDSPARLAWESWRLGYLLTSGVGRGYA